MKLINKIIFSIVCFFVANNAFGQVLNEGFEGATFPPNTSGNWITMDNGVGTTVNWTETIDAARVHSGTKAAIMDRENVGAGNTSVEWLVTPRITVSANNQLRFFTRQTLTGPNGSNYEIRVSTNPTQNNQSAYTTIQTWTEAELNATFNIYEEKIVSLAAYPSGTQLYIAFVKTNFQDNSTTDGDRWLIDDVKVLGQCFDPNILTVGSITPTSASLGWTNNGTATQWEVVVQPSGTGLPAGSGTSTSTNPFTTTGLAPGTLYEFYVRANCGGGNYSQWAGPINFSTTPIGSICSTPINISTLPYSHTSNTNLYGDTVDTQPSSTCIGGTFQNYLEGRDAFYSFSTLNPMMLEILFTAQQPESSIFVFDGCTNVGVNCLQSASPIAGQQLYMGGLYAEPGHVYIIVISSKTTPTSGIDYNLLVQEQITNCTAPVVTNSNITTSSAYFQFSDNLGQPFQVVLVQNTSSNTNYIPTNAPDQTNNFYNATGLNPGSSYTLWVRKYCGNGMYSAWAKSTILTYCDSPQIVSADYINQMPRLHFTQQNTNSPTIIRREVCIKPFEPGVTPSSMVPQLFNDPYYYPNSFETSGLEPDIIYNAYVRSDCGSNGYSDWSAPYKIGGSSDFSQVSCVKIATEANQPIKNLFKSLVNHLLGIVNIGGTVANGYNPTELQDLSQYLSEINPRIYNFSYQNGTIEFSFSNHPGALRKDVKITGYSPSFGLLTDFDINSFVSPLYFIYNAEANFGSNNTCRLFLKHIRFCENACIPIDGDIVFSNCAGAKGECDYTCGERTVYTNANLNIDYSQISPLQIVTYQWTFKDPNGNIIGTSNEAYPSFTFSTVGNNTIHLTVIDSNGCVTTLEPETVIVENCNSCTKTNPRTQIVKTLFTNLVTRLYSLNPADITDGFICPELTALAPYITDANPAIYNYTIDTASNRVKFSFAPHDRNILQDVEIEMSESISNLTAFGMMTDVNVSSYISSEILIDRVDAYFENGFGKIYIKHINFCPDELCVNHVAIVVDESGSIDNYDKARIKRQLRKFLLKQAELNDANPNWNMHVSLIGMSDRDADIRTDHVLYKRVSGDIDDPTSNLRKLMEWVEGPALDGIKGYGSRYGFPTTLPGISGGSDFWKSGLDAATSNFSAIPPKLVIMITDGSQTADIPGLKNTMAKFNNYQHATPIDPAKPHLYIVGITNGFYVYDEQSALQQRPRNEDPNYVPSLRSSSVTSRTTPALSLSLRYLLQLPNPIFPTNSLENVNAIPDFATDDYIGYTNFETFADPDSHFLSDNMEDVYVSCGKKTPTDPCDDCFSFQPEPGKVYVLNAWAKEELNVQVKKYTNPKITLKFLDIDKSMFSEISFSPNTNSDIIEGWQRIGGKFEIPSNTFYMEFQLSNESDSVPVFFDDIRIYPVKGSMKSFVYDPETFKLMSELDENNYATYYEYDNEGGLVRIKKETIQGVKTIQETRSGNYIKPQE